LQGSAYLRILQAHPLDSVISFNEQPHMMGMLQALSDGRCQGVIETSHKIDYMVNGDFDR
jgi:hypothetical protein